jgi:hypothetical protein
MGNRYLSSIAAGLLIFQVHQGWSQNVGVGQANPAEMLDVAGRIHLSTNNAGGVPSGGAGTFRWNGSRFEGYNGSQWVSFETPSLLNGRIFVGNASDVATGVVMSGDATVSNTGALTIANSAVTSAKIADGTIVNADVDAAAAIARTKLASGTANRLLVNNGSGVLSELSAGSDGNLIQNVSGVPTWIDAGGVFIRNQTTLQATSNFQISGVGRANTSFQSPLYTRADAGTVAIRPNTNSATAIQLQNASGTSILNVDATNSRVGIGNVAPEEALEITGNLLFSRAAPRTISVQTSSSSVDGWALNVIGGNASTAGSAAGGGDLVLQAGSAYKITGSDRGGNLVLRSGANQTSGDLPNGGDIIFATGGATNSFTTRMQIKENGTVVSHNNIYVDDNSRGVILRSPNNNCWRLTVSDAGVVTAVSATCP